MTDKYERLVALQRDLYDFAGPSPDQSLQKGITERFDAVLGLLMDEFTPDKATMETPEFMTEVRALFHNPVPFDPLNTNALRAVQDGVIAVLISRHMLAIRRLAVEPINMLNWDRFSDAYDEVILRA